MKKLGFLLIFSVLAGVPMALLTAYSIFDIARLFEIPVISQMSPPQIYGSAVIIYLLITSARKNKDNEVDLSKTYKEIFSTFTSLYISRISIVLISWGTVYFMYWVFSLLG